MRKNDNNMNIEGKIYQFDLEVKEVKNEKSKNFGKNYITGTIDVATYCSGSLFLCST